MRKAKRPREPKSTWRITSICLCLVALTWLAFGQTLKHDFVNYDDATYVYENPVVSSGLTLRGIGWAFTHAHARNWHPLTTLSHMLDCQFFGLNAGGHHFTNVLLHTAAVLLLFLVLRDMTGSPSRTGDIWRSAFVAAAFAIHPLRVESVAWIAERKDVLSAVFFMLTLGAYVRYSRLPTVGRYLAVAISFALGLMSKPMLVTVPFVLLLLDYWPLNRGHRSEVRGRKSDIQSVRFATRTWSQLVIEKIPLLVLSVASCLATILAQSGSLGAMEPFPLGWRINNALVTYFTYVWQMIWPANLAVFYPHPENRLAIWQIILAAIFLIGVSGAAIALRRARPYFFTGWFWYLVMLVPVIGVFQIGMQGHADRYTYLPQIGLYLAVTWVIGDLSKSWQQRRVILGTAAAIVLAALSWIALKQTSSWRDSETLWKHALSVTSKNDVAHNNLGALLEKRGQLDDAISHYRTAMKIQTDSGQARYSLGLALTHSNIGNVLVRKGDLDNAIMHYQKAVELRPDFANGRYSLGSALLEKGETDEAIAQCQKALSIQPDDAEARTTLGNALLQKGKLREGINEYEKALETAPKLTTTLNNLAWVLAAAPDDTIRNGTRAIELAQRAVQLSGGKNPMIMRTLSAAYAESGRFNEAIQIAERAMQVALAQGQRGVVNQLERNIARYRDNSPLRDSSLVNTP